MTVLEEVDYKVRKVISILFRILIIGYAILVLLLNQNIFPYYVYLIAIVSYAAIYIKIFRKEGYYANVRLINDYVFFFLCLYDKDINNLFNLSLLVIPVINALNHSSYQRTPFFSVPLYSIVLFSYYLLNGYQINVQIILVITALAAINFFSFIRASIVRFQSLVHSAIDKFYEENLNVGKAYLLLKNIIDALSNDGFVFKYLAPVQIICFKIRFEELRIFASSHQILDIKIPEENKLVKTLKKFKSERRNDVLVNGVAIQNCLFMYIKSDSAQFAYCLQFENNSFGILHKLLINVLRPLLFKVTKVFGVEDDLKRQKKVRLNKIKGNYFFIDNTIKAIHYLNNKLIPITTYFEMISVYDQVQDKEAKRQLSVLINKEKKRSSKVIKDVISRTHKILDKSLNPYFIDELYEEGFYRIFELVRTAWDDNGFDTKSININWPVEILGNTVQFNEDAFLLVVDEILDNINKHYNCNCSVDFLIIEEFPLIKFTNDLQDHTQKKQLKKLAQDFNNQDINEIMKRDSHGSSIIKQYLNQMNIKSAIRVNESFELIVVFTPNNK
ncbi:hypothetical protein [Pontibacter lucknowensis]|uniref:Uncharacterized protein n=1 Tax=Pontibacter lucknowensis TaxID=1077936 RepID=A0A1N6W1T9_9BACT|nr:hypothetical protein [Pontibacter lucknowensis]SIQ84143.1 hypothetical protein SAMN05421545_1320 [Pontibacter lucknowensis]